MELVGIDFDVTSVRKKRLKKKIILREHIVNVWLILIKELKQESGYIYIYIYCPIIDDCNGA